MAQELGIYKGEQGGLRSVGIEQLVIRSGGSFDAVMEQLYSWAVTSDDGQTFVRQPHEEVAAHWVVEHPAAEPGHIYQNVLNFLDRIHSMEPRSGERNWQTLVTMAWCYNWMKHRDKPFAIDRLVKNVQNHVDGVVQDAQEA